MSLDATREPIEDDPLSDWDEGDGDQDMPDANEQQGDRDPTGSGPTPMLIPDETQEGAQLCDDQMEAGDDEEPQEPKEPLEPYQIVLQGFRTISQTLSVAYGATSAEIQIIVRKSLAKTTAEDRTFIWGASGPFANGWTPSGQQWLVQRKAPRTKPNYWQRLGRPGRDVLETVLSLIPEEEDP